MVKTGNEKTRDIHAEVSARLAEYERIDQETIDFFSGKKQKIVKLMKELHDFDDDVSNEDFYKVAEKIKKLMKKEELNISLKIKALEKEQREFHDIRRFMHNSYDMWFYYAKEYVENKKKINGD